MIRTGGNWNPKDWPIYFVASSPNVFDQSIEVLDHILIAVNELEGGSWKKTLTGAFDNKRNVFIDSGVYWLSTQHAKKHRISMDQALSMAPTEIDGFDELFEKYVEVNRTYANEVWGYIEIDQGGRENKIKTRKRLEKLGLRPIPVYHPFNDGWDYFDYLAERYDRICFGNVVMADRATRKRLVATAWERRRRYPNLWIHLLGMTPSDITTAFPINSMDSSTWVGSVRWNQHHAHIGTSAIALDTGFTYQLGARTNDAGWNRAIKLSGYNATMLGLAMNNMAREAERELGADIGMFETT
jgi:hypothetical protein